MAKVRNPVSVELIPFQNPTIPNLYIPRISWPGSHAELVEHLRVAFADFGLTHSIHAQKSGSSEDEASPSWFAYVRLFSLSAVQKAKLNLHNKLEINGSKCYVVQKVRSSFTDLPLSVRKCEELANSYLGFNGWSTQILYHRLEDSPESEARGKKVVKYCTAIRITFPKCPGVECEGAGMATQEFDPSAPSDKAQAMQFVQKHSRSAALQNAFAKVILVVVNGAKVSVEIDSTKLDPFYYDPIWEKYEVTVDDVNYSICDEDDEDPLVQFDP